MRVLSVLVLSLIVISSATSRRKRQLSDTLSIERFAKYNVIVSHQRLGDCSFIITFMRADMTSEVLAKNLTLHYTIDDSLAMQEYPVDTGTTVIQANQLTETLYWDPPEGFVPPFDTTGVTQISGTQGGTIIQHTMDDGPCTPASTRGDPHLRSFDGHGFSFQGLCWYTLAKHCTDNPDFEITTEFAPRESTGTQIRTRAVRMNITVGDEMISMDTDNHVTVNGKAYYVAKLDGLPRNVALTVVDSRVIIRIPKANMDILWEGRRHSFSASLYHPDYKGNLCGLLGNADGDPLNDFEKRDGWLTQDINEFGESWRIEDKSCDY
ncbi:BMP-binding endothelial regulator protein-like [Saccoglossus kowalevskii]|uniref:BMP-binding endothelial regulator protein-like n=1 Tax=Saccoglossus kowalevskii TaxID=10224 RepID=A0A0U2US46_SACKO|nr:PREDICTED: BMP-binding endothelial regulator protein-like [Saccoglossus kowalevskii]ALR88630.1 von Willebrand type d domain containing protein-like m23 [Saccoglossus kowalevskii]